MPAPIPAATNPAPPANRLPPGRPLIPVPSLMAVLDRNEDDVLDLIGRRLLRFAFDIRGLRPSGREVERSEIRVLRASVLDYAAKGEAQLLAAMKEETLREEDTLLRGLLPGEKLGQQRRHLARPEVARLFNCSSQHIGNLVKAGLLVKVRHGDRINRPDAISSDSVVAFLKRRRMPR